MTNALKTALFLFRHGETDWNKTKRWQGQMDIPLNDLGRAQARQLIPALTTVKLDLLVSSDLVRAQETAQIVATALHLPLMLNVNFRELSFGHAEGKTVDEIVADFGGEARDRCRSMLNQDLDFRFPGGESKRQLISRTSAALFEVTQKNPNARSLGIGTHGGVIRCLIQATRGEQNEPIPVANGSLFHFDFEPDRARLTFVAQMMAALP